MKTIKGKVIMLIALLILTSCMVIIHENVKPAHATVTTITLSSPADNAHSMDTTPDFIFTAISDNDTSITCDVYVNNVASGNITATNNTATTITCNHTLTVSGDAYEWYVNGTDPEGTTKSAVRNLYIVPDTGPIDKDGTTPKPDDYEPDQQGPTFKLHEIAGGVVFILTMGFLVVMLSGKRGKLNRASRHRKR